MLKIVPRGCQWQYALLFCGILFAWLWRRRRSQEVYIPRPAPVFHRHFAFADPGSRLYPQVEYADCTDRSYSPTPEPDDHVTPLAMDRSSSIDYTSIYDHPVIPDSITSAYEKESLRQLAEDFPSLHRSDLALLWQQNDEYYAPTFRKCYHCVVRSAPIRLGYRFVRVNMTARVSSKNADKRPIICPDFEEELLWVQNWKARYDKKRAKKLERASNTQARRELRKECIQGWIEEHSIASPVASRHASILSDAPEGPDVDRGVPDASLRVECGCCCDDSASFMDMMQCPDGHLFCKDCVRMQAETVIGNRGTEILCMDQSNCGLPFTREILADCLDESTFSLWETIKQNNDIRGAGIEDLEICPFCDYAVVNPFTMRQVPLFHCEKCRTISCRRCGRMDHTGQPCHDRIEAARQGERHVEEAMTNAVVRKCPRCETPFIKEHGCNKIVCHSCQAICCYICRKQVLDPRPYDHFVGQGEVDNNKCPLWDGDGSADPTVRHAAEIAAAEKEARRRLQANEAGPSRIRGSLRV